MLLALKHRMIAVVERGLGTRLEYLRVMARTSPGSLRRMAMCMPLAGYRRTVPAELLHLARIGAVLVEDCGECLQITVHVARKEGVAPDLIRNAVNGHTEALRADERDAWTLGRMLVSHDAAFEEVRSRVEARHGEAGIVEFSLAVASAQLFPTVKRGMGLSRSCDTDALELMS